MRHLVAGRRLGRSVSHKRAMFRNLSISLLVHERIKTTLPKAKELRRIVERLITWGKRGDLHSRRLARTMIENSTVLKKLFTEIKERFANRKGGYTRVIKLFERRGDCAPMALIELIPDEKAKAKKALDKAKKKKAKREKAEAKSEEKTEKKEAPKAEEKPKEKK